MIEQDKSWAKINWLLGPCHETTLQKIIPFAKTGNTKQKGVLCGKIIRFTTEAKRTVKYNKKQEKIESGALSYTCHFQHRLMLKLQCKQKIKVKPYKRK